MIFIFENLLISP